MKNLTITVETKIVDKWEQIASCTPPMVYARNIEVIIDFLLRIDGHRTTSLIVTMDAPDRGQNDDRLRDELIQSARSERRFHVEGIWARDGDDQWTIEIIDPTGVLKWFGIDQAADLFKQNQNNDKPLRLPAARFD